MQMEKKGEEELDCDDTPVSPLHKMEQDLERALDKGELSPESKVKTRGGKKGDRKSVV